MLQSFRHKGLKRFYEDDDSRGVHAEHLPKLRNILARLDAAVTVDDMNLPGFKLHRLQGSFQSLWSVTVRANWRVIFRFSDGEAFEIDYLDYH